MQPGFQNLPIKGEIRQGRFIKVSEPVHYLTCAGDIITIPAGAESDGASTPQPMWNVLPPFGPYWEAAVLHDYLYRYTTKPKAYCDSTLLEAMELSGVGEVERMTIYEGVHIGGWKAFRDDRQGSV